MSDFEKITKDLSNISGVIFDEAELDRFLYDCSDENYTGSDPDILCMRNDDKSQNL